MAAAELFLRYDMLAKLQFLRDVDATPGWTGRLLTQNFEGTVTITPALQFRDYFEILKNPDEKSLPRFLRGGCVLFFAKCYILLLERLPRTKR